MTGVLIRKFSCEDRDTGRMSHKDGGGIEVLQQQAKECLGLPDTGRGKESFRRSPPDTLYTEL